MDKLLLSPDYSVANQKNNKEFSEFGSDAIITKSDSSISEGACLTNSSKLNNTSSPTTELLEFLTFHKHVHRFKAENISIKNPGWALMPDALQHGGTKHLYPSATILTNLNEPDIDAFPQLQNVVASVNLGCKLDLRRIAMYAQNVEYNPRRIPVLYLRIREPCALALVFGNGKLICTGPQNVQISHRAARKFARIIQKLGFPVKFSNYKVENLVASCEVKFHIRLELFDLFMHNNCVYEPELFPGLIFRVARSRAQILIFSSGRVILSGARHNYELQKSFREIYPLLKLFQKKS